MESIKKVEMDVEYDFLILGTEGTMLEYNKL